MHGAISIYRRALEFQPTLEDVVRALYRCLEQIGNRAGLIREGRRLREALRAELADTDDPDDDPDLYGPSPDTVELFESIMDRLAPGSGRRQCAAGERVLTAG